MRMLAPAAWLALGALGCSIIGERTLLAARATVASALPSGAETNTGAQVPSPPADSAAASQADDPVLAELRSLLDEARAAQEAKDFAGARTRIAEAIEKALAQTTEREDARTCVLLDEMGLFARGAGELRGAEALGRRVLAVFLRTLPADARNLQAARQNLAGTIRAQGDLAGARVLFEEVHAVYSRTLSEDHPDLQSARQNLAVTMREQGDIAGARALEEEVLAVRSRTLPADHRDLQSARQNLAGTILELGDIAGARALFEEVHAVYSRTLPEDHPDLQAARQNLAVTIRIQGDLAGARVLFEEVLAVYSRTLPADHPDLQTARQRLAGTLTRQGDLAGARALFEEVLAFRLAALPEDHPDVQSARGDLAVTIKEQGDLAGARALEEGVLAVRSRTLPADHPALQLARQNLAATLQAQGDLASARALEEQVLAVRSRTLPEDHPDLQSARGNLAGTIYRLGDIASARALQERVLAVSSRTLPADHPDLQNARNNLAVMIQAQGDVAGARALQEEVLAVRSRTLPEDHPDVLSARNNLAETIRKQGDLAGARALQEEVLAVSSRTLPADHPDLQRVRGNLAVTIRNLGDLAGARALEEEVLAVSSRTLPEDHPELQQARHNLAATIYAQGDLAAARALQERVLAVRSRTLPEDHPDLQTARHNLALTIGALVARTARASGDEGERDREREVGRERCAELVLALCRARTSAARAALLESAAREAQARCESLAADLGTYLSIAAGCGAFEPIPALERASFVLGETTRGAALGAAALMRRAAGAPEYGGLRDELRRASDELAGLAQKGTTSDEFHAAIARRDGLQRDLARLARELAGGAPAGLDFDVAALAASLSEKEAAVGFRRYVHWSFESPTDGDGAGSAAPRHETVASLCALVLRRDSEANPRDDRDATTGVLTRVELGPIAPIEAAVSDWREAIGAGLERGLGIDGELADAAHATGVELRRLVFDPLLAVLGDAERVVIALDDVLHLVSIEALPLDEESSGDRRDAALVGERWRIETRCTLAELLAPAPSGSGADILVSLGGASFNSEPLAPNAEDVALVESALESAAAPKLMASIVRGGAWERGFAPLTYTGLEAREVAALHDEVFEGATSVVLEKRKASRASLAELAPRARWLHVATHGWFAPESIRSWSDARALDEQSGLALRTGGEEQVKGMSPMLLCGLALAGANLPENELGRAPGLMTAEELSALDLSNCELVVLSACDTNVGERRAGQGVASLQMALQMAGAKSVITSLWKVPDEATRELMADFYRRLWVEKKPKHQALWEAKMRLRDAVDERGEPRYSTRDWAAWVLTGEQD